MSDPVGPRPSARSSAASSAGRRGPWSAVAHRCPCGQPDVVETSPRLEDGTPFPTLYYLTCPRATAAASRLESAGRMREWQDELATDPELAAGYRAAHEAYLAARDARDVLPTRGDRRRDARPGQVPARAGRARAGRRARASTRSATARSPRWGSGGRPARARSRRASAA